MAKKFSKPSAIILDIEGTTTDGKFVSKTLFPFIRNNLNKYLNDNFETTETKEAIQRIREASNKDPQMPAIAKDGKDAVVKSVTENMIWQMDKKRRSSEIKALEILIWIWGYEKGLLKGHLFDDVPQAMHNWKKKLGIKIYIYSSGMVTAQQLLFSCSNHGNLYILIDLFFDNSIGLKTEPESYKTIAKTAGVPVNNMLFITDSANEAKAAVDAGCKAGLITRSGKANSSQNENITNICSFADIKF